MTKKGFTLIELLTTIAIIGILATVGFSFDFNKKTDMEKRDRFAEKISSLIHSTLLNTSSGKGIKVGTDIINPSDTRIRFSTGSIGIYYYSGGTVIGTGEIMNSPFFGETPFVLGDIYGKKKDSSTGSIDSLPIEIVFDSGGDLSFSGSDANLSSYVGIGMTVWYHSMKKTVEFDRRFGKITFLP